jgi:Protein of unknown function (DUF2505)
VRFEIVHEFDIPLDAIELAVLSPTLAAQLLPRLPEMERVTQKSHVLENGILDRVWEYSANVKVPAFAKPYVTQEMLGWEERSRYDLKKHEGRWTIAPLGKIAWQKYLHAEGTYSLLPEGDGSVRIIEGVLDLLVPIMRGVAERLILKEVKKTFNAEAATLRDLATLV